MSEHNPNLIEHHTKYLEIDGIDETVWLTRSEHQSLHFKLKREGKDKIPLDILVAAQKRTQKFKDRVKANGKTAHHKIVSSSYRRANKKTLHFTEKLLPSVRLMEMLDYNITTGTIGWRAFFYADNKKELFYVDC